MSKSLPAGHKTPSECWKAYPQLPFPDNLLRGTAQKRARKACLDASFQGRADPQLIKGPAIFNQPKKLWETKEPWSRRPVDTAGNVSKVVGRIVTLGTSSLKAGGGTLRTIAIGWRPPSGPGTARYREAERKGTILGGLDALIAAGVQPWVQLANRVKKLPPAQLRGDTGLDMLLVGLAHDGAKALGHSPPKSLKSAAEYIRTQVKKADLSAAAWHARAMRIALMGAGAQGKSAKVTGATSSALSATALGMNAAAGAIGSTIVGLPVAVVLSLASGIPAIFSGVLGAASGITAASKLRNDALVKESARKFAHELAMRNIRLDEKMIEDQFLSWDSLEAAWKKQGENIAKGVLWGTALGALGLGLVFAARKYRSTR
jgi:hypothetical protein